MLLLLGVLSNDCMNDSLKDVLFWYNALHIFDKIVCIVDLIVFKVEYHEIESSFWNNINQWRKYLKGVLSSSEYNQVVSEKIVVVENVSGG